MQRLTGKVAIVTGASQGIGATLARGLAAEGAKIVIADVGDGTGTAQEIIREQLYHQLGKELPYACAVQIETWTAKNAKELAIGAVIVVERDSQKAIVVGRGGARIRELGIAARQAVGRFEETVPT